MDLIKIPDAPLKLLVIDDDDVDRMQLKRALATSGYEFKLTESAVINNITDYSLFSDFDCIFLDYLLPGDNGLLLIKKIRDKGINVPVVIITSQGNESIAVELMKAGASDYVVKNDITGPSLGKILRNMLEMRRILQEREQTGKALRISESRLAVAQRIAKIGNWEFDVNSNSFYCSDEIYNALGSPHGIEINIQMLLELVHPEDRDMARKTWSDKLGGKPATSIDFRIVTTAGIKFMNSQAHVICDRSGKAEKIIGTLQDITERKLGEAEISKAREQAENSIKVREVFLANMSHEIRTPMNAILGFTDLLYGTSLTTEQKTFIDAIHFSGENLLVVINDILDLSKIRSGKMTIEKCDFNLQEVIISIMAMMAAKAEEKGLDLTYSIDRNIPAVIKGDPVRLSQVLTNLISNAIKFTQHGSVNLTINSNTSENQDVLITFNVSDTGIGIPEDKQALIFDKFVQASDDTTRKYGGSGLGLTIVKSLVELQDGKITLISQPGMGSTFQVDLPFEQSLVVPPAKVLSEDDTRGNLLGTRVLVAEDNAVNQLLIRKVLQKAGCEIDIASNGAEALIRIREKQYDIVLMDIQMPEMDGYEATRHIRKLPKPFSEIPIVAMTAHAFGSDVTRCLSAGMNDYISKPFKAPDVYAKVRRYVGDAKMISGVQILNGSDHQHNVDLSAIHQLAMNDTGFIHDLIAVFDKQTPAFIEKLQTYAKTHNYGAIRSVCHQIHSSYGIVKMPALDYALREIVSLLDAEKTDSRSMKVTKLVNIIINRISDINEKVKRGLRKTEAI